MTAVQVLVILPLLLVGTTGAADVYRWLDADGHAHYTDTPPPPTARGVQQKKLGNQAGGARTSAQVSYAVRQAAKNFPVTLYASDSIACGEPCARARALLVQRGIPFTLKDPQQDPAAAETLKKLVGGELLVPVLTVDNDTLRGFEQAHWHGALDLAGYPKGSPSEAVSPETSKSTPGAAIPPQRPPAQ